MNGILELHMKTIHEKVKNHHHSCDKCGIIFKWPSNLKKHVAIVHEGEQKYQCDHCGQAFGRQYSLRKHVEIIHLG